LLLVPAAGGHATGEYCGAGAVGVISGSASRGGTGQQAGARVSPDDQIAIAAEASRSPAELKAHAVLEAQARTRDALTIALTLVTGATDAVAFLRLGNVFTSVMTGNMVLLGIAVGRGELGALEHTGLAVVMFILGTIAGARIAGRPRADDPVWPRPISLALCVELAIFAAVAICWWAGNSHPAGALQSVELGASALALGIQSSAILRLNVSGLSTTYLTGTLTTLVQTLTTTHRLKGSGRSLCVLIALIVGAAIGALAAVHIPAAAPVVSVVILICVLLVAELKFVR
jgi:uncharacterized membrane protein YoaK (UPF0700 family)